MKKMTLTAVTTLATALLIAATSALAADTPATPALAPATASASKITPQSTVLRCEASMSADRPMWQRILSLGIASAVVQDKAVGYMDIPGNMAEAKAFMAKNQAAGEIMGGAVSMFRPDVIAIQTHCTDSQGAEVVTEYRRQTGVMEYRFRDAKSVQAAKDATRNWAKNSHLF